MGISQMLRPLSIGEILDRTFRLYRNHFFLLIGIVALALVPMTILQVLSQLVFGDIQFINLIQNAFVLCLIQGGLAHATSCAYLSQPFSIGAAYQAGFRRYGSLWGSNFLEGLAIGIPIVIIAGCGIVMTMGGSGATGGIAAIILTLLFVPYAAYLGTRWLLTIPSITLEEIGATEGLRRSWNLTDGVFWRVLGVSLLTSLLTFLIAQLPGMAVTYGLAYFFPEASVGQVIAVVMTGLSLILALPFSVGVIVLLYYDLRVRREGYDLELQAQELATQPGGQV